MLFLRNLSRATFISHGSLNSFPWQALWRDPASEIRRAMVPPVSIEHRGPVQDEKGFTGLGLLLFVAVREKTLSTQQSLDGWHLSERATEH